MKILIQGAGIAGCYVAAALSQQGHNVTVVEKKSNIFTRGAGIVLYSNALKCLDYIGVLDKILLKGCTLSGDTEFWSYDSKLLGKVYFPSIEKKYPSYVGINRYEFLKILYKTASRYKVKFHFNCFILNETLNGYLNSKVSLNNGISDNYDLIIAADGTNSSIRQHLFKNQQSVFTNFGLWHSLHLRRPEINEKIIVIGDGFRLGFVPLDNEYMYTWAAMPEESKYKIPIEQQPAAMKEKFSSHCNGLVKEIIDEIDSLTHVNFTCVEEVNLPKPWNKGNIVFIGDSAHASLPFMAQGGAQALQDAATLTQLLNLDSNLDNVLKMYVDYRYDIARYVQTQCRQIGLGFKSKDNFDLKISQSKVDDFYLNEKNFILPNDLLGKN